MTLENYKYGIINGSDGDGTAYSVLSACGGVVFEKGTDYSESCVDADGEPFGDSFEFKDVPTVGSGGGTSGAVVSIFADTYTNSAGEYELTAIYAPDAESGSHKIASLNWNYHSQLVSGYDGLPNPAIPSAKLFNRIKFIVVDDGITEIGSYGFIDTKARIVILPESLTTMRGRTFVGASELKTLYTVHSREKTIGLIELGSIASLDLTQMFEKATSVEYIHLPSGTVSSADKDLSGCSALLAVWCGDSAKPSNGTVDLSNSSITKLSPKDGALQISCAKIDTLILPSSCVSVTDGAISGIETIYQSVNVAAISEYCEKNNITYIVNS